VILVVPVNGGRGLPQVPSTTIEPRVTHEVPPNLADYDATRTTFTWEAARAELDGLPGDRGLNIAYEAVDRHLLNGRGDHVALRWLGRRDAVRNITYDELAALTDRFANALESLGVRPSDRLFVLSGRVPELYVAALGTLKARATFSPLFSAFGPEPIQQRINLGEGRVLVTTESLYRRKVADIRNQLPTLRHVILIGRDGAPTEVEGTHDFHALLDAASDEYEIGPTDPEHEALLHFTSGTTGRPKGAIHVHQAVVAHHSTAKYALDLHPDDIFWCTSDPGWVTGTSYGIIAPLTHGVTCIIDEADFDAARWYRILQEQRVTVWYTAPTAVRMLMKVGADLPRQHDLSHLRLVSSVGEPLNPEAVLWGQQVLGMPILDNWWQTETGGIMIANYPSMPVRPGSMGRPLPGIDVAVVRHTNGAIELIDDPSEEGKLALRRGWPSMFRGYYHEDERYQRCFSGDWYLTGDLARIDEDGYYWFVGRTDDMIKSAGHLIGPFEVESSLLEHPAVAEVGVIGKPDPIVGEVVKAFVSLHEGFEPSKELQRELLAHGRQRLGTQVAPKEIDFADDLPKTRSGKIMRRLLKARELGLPEGDLSTLETLETPEPAESEATS
jgi:acetyl-CoA synthetase